MIISTDPTLETTMQCYDYPEKTLALLVVVQTTNLSTNLSIGERAEFVLLPND